MKIPNQVWIRLFACFWQIVSNRVPASPVPGEKNFSVRQNSWNKTLQKQLMVIKESLSAYQKWAYKRYSWKTHTYVPASYLKSWFKLQLGYTGRSVSTFWGVSMTGKIGKTRIAPCLSAGSWAWRIVAGSLFGVGGNAGMEIAPPWQWACPWAIPAAGDEPEGCHINILAA